MESIEISTHVRQTITNDLAWRLRIVPKDISEEALSFLSDTTSHKEITNELEVLTGKKIKLIQADKEIIEAALNRYYRRSEGLKSTRSKQFNGKGEFLEEIITEASELNSSDIHLESFRDHARIRIRIDGKLIEKYIIKKHEYGGWVNKIKVKAGLDIAEKRLPQDGRIRFGSDENYFDIRVSVVPSIYGEKIVLRLLDRNAQDINITDLGFSPGQLKDFLDGIKKPSGIILISGPTGSGKTTTLYAALKELNREQYNILTIEDPVEYTLEGINQVQVKDSIGFSFASALRVFLRQDPDIIMVGEIRDKETAQLAIRAALTGHLVLSTIHTNSAVGTIERLIDIGIPAYQVASVLNLSVAQRLVRKLCTSCKKPAVQNAADKITHKNQIFTPTGCPRCHFTGYSGRTAIYEVLPVDKQLSDLIRSKALYNYTHNKDTRSLSQAAKGLIDMGITALDEVEQIINHY